MIIKIRILRIIVNSGDVEPIGRVRKDKNSTPRNNTPVEIRNSFGIKYQEKRTIKVSDR